MLWSLSTLSLSAQSIIWTGSTDSSWFNNTNWNSATTPGSASPVSLANGNTVQITGAANSAAADTLTITDGLLFLEDATLKLSTGLTLGALGELEIDGGILSSALDGTTTLTGLSGSQLIFSGAGGGTFANLIDGVIDLFVEAGVTTLTAANTFSGELNHSEGTLNLSTDHSFTAAALTAGTLGGAGDVTFNGTTSISRYYLNNTGTTTFAGTTTLSRSGSTAYQWLYLYPGAAATNTGTFNFSDTDADANDVHLYLRGNSSADATFTNAAGGTLNFTTGSSSSDLIYVDGSTATYNHFINAGTINLSSTGDGAAIFDTGTSFLNRGLLALASGTLYLQSPTADAHTGSFTIASGAVLDLDASSQTFGDGASISGAGTLRLSGASATFDTGASVTVDHLDLETGRIDGTADLTLPGDIEFYQIYFDGPGAITLDGTSTINRTGSSAYRWIQVSLGATVINSGTFNLTDTDDDYNDAHVYLRGNSSGTATFVNAADGILNLHTGAGNNDRVYFDGSNATYNHVLNEGTINITSDGSAGYVDFDSGVSFTNQGQVNLSGGILYLEGGDNGTMFGDFAVSAGAVLNFFSGTTELGSGATVSGAGTTIFDGGTTSFLTGAALQTTGLEIAGGTVKFADDHTFGDATLTTGHLGGTGDLTFTGDIDFYQFYFDGTGEVTLSGTSTITRSGTGPYRWIDLEEGATVVNTGTFNLTDTDDDYADAHIYLRGDSTGVATFINADGGIMNLHTGAGADDRIYIDGSNTTYNHFLNEGTLNLTSDGTVGYVDFDTGTTFTNQGQVNVDGGILYLEGGDNGTMFGDFTVASGAELNFYAGTYALGSGADITGAGRVKFAGATVEFQSGATLPIDNVLFTSGHLQGDAQLSVPGTVDIYQFYLDGPGKLILTGTTTLTRTGTAAAEWLQLNESATVENSGTFNLGDTGAYGNDTHLLFRGDSTGDTLFHNLSDGILNLTTGADAADIIYFDGTNLNYDHVINDGSIVVASTGSGRTVFDTGVTLDNQGTISVTGGYLELAGGSEGTQTGTYTVAAGAEIEFDSGTHTFGTGAQITGDGDLLVTGATLNFNAPPVFSVANIDWTSGTLGGSADVSLPATLDITNLNIVSTGVVTLAGTSTLQRSGSENPVTLDIGPNSEVVNSGTFQMSNFDNYGYYPIFDFNGSSGTPAVFRNTGTFTTYVESGPHDRVHFDGSNSNYDFFYNEGTFNATGLAGDGSVLADSGVAFVNSGTVNVTAATFQIQGGDATGTAGDYLVSSGALLNLNGGTYTLLSSASISGDGTLSLTSNATLSLTSGSVFDIALLDLVSGSFTGTDAVTISGDADFRDFTINGTGAKTFTGDLTLTRSGTSNPVYFRISANAEAINAGTFTLSNFDNYGYYPTVDFNGASGALARFRNTGTLTTYVESGPYDRVHFDGSNQAYDFFYNEGTFNATGEAGDGYTLVDSGVSFVNSGTVNVTGATLRLQGGDDTGTSGDFLVSAGAQLNLDGGAYTLQDGASINGAGTLELTGNAQLHLNAGADLSVAQIQADYGTLAGDDDATISGDIDFRDFTVSGTGAKTFTGDLIVSRSSSSNPEYLHLSAGTEMINAGTFTLSNTDNYGYFAYLDLNGDSTASTIFRNTGTFTTYVESGTYDRVYLDGANNAYNFFLNEGVFNATGQAGDGFAEADTQLAFVNSGTVNVTGATLRLRGGDGTGTTGDFQVGTGTRLEFDSGSFHLQSGAAVSGPGTFAITGNATVTVDTGAILDVGQVELTSGNLTGSGTATLTGNASVSSFTVSGTGTKTFAGDTTLSRSGSEGPKYLYVASGSELLNSGSFLMSNTDNYGYYPNLHLLGTSTDTSTFRNTGTFTTYVESGSYDRVFLSGANAAYNTFLNEGTFNATGEAGTGTAEISSNLAFVNTGTVNVTGATLRIEGPDRTGTTGTFNVATGAELNFAGATLSLADSVALTGAGTIRLDNNANFTLDAATSIDVGTFALTYGTLQVATNATISGGADIDDGTITGGGTLTLAGTSSLQRSGSDGAATLHVSAGTEIVNSGDLTLGNTGGYGYLTTLDLNGTSGNVTTFRNTGSLTVATGPHSYDRVVIDGNQVATDQFINEGSIQISGTGDGSTTFDAGVDFLNSGSIDLQSGTLNIDGAFTQTAGSLSVSSGTLNKTNGALNIAGGVLQGNGTIIGDVSFTGGELAPGLSPGTLTIDGDLILYSGSLFTIEITGAIAGTQYDVVNVTGNMDLSGGVIELAFGNNYAPAPGDTFNFFNVDGSFTGASSINVTGLLPGWTFDTSFDALTGNFSLTSTSFAAVPEPSTWALMLTGGALLLLHARRRRVRR